jgi:hypothetical protein
VSFPGGPVPSVPPEQGGGGSLAVSLSARMVGIEELLRRIADQSSAGVQSFAVSDGEVQGDGLEVDFPVVGAKRWLIQRTARGGQIVLPNIAEYVDIAPTDNRRVGGTLVNRGEADAVVVLAPAAQAKAAGGALGTVFLAAGGGSWDFRLGPLLWCGSICAICSKRGAIETTTLALVAV